MAKFATDISLSSQRLRVFKRNWGHKKGHRMKNNKLIFTQGFIDKLEIPKVRTQYYDLRVPGLLLEIMPTGAKFFRFRKKVAGRSQRTTIGAYPQLSIEQARDEAIKKAAQIVDGIEFKHARDELTLEQLANLYFDQYVSSHCVTAHKMRQNFSRWWKTELPLKISQVDTQTIQLRINKFAIEGHCRSANAALTILKAIFNWSLKRKFVTTNPTFGVDKFKDKSRDRFLQDHEFAPLLKAINDYPDKRMTHFFLLALYTGARSGNIKTMKWDQVDLEAGIWTIPCTKSGDSQVIQLSEAALEILKERAKTRELNPYVLPGGRHTSNTKHMEEPKKAWEVILKAAGIQNLHIHDLRRSLASVMVMNNVSSATIMRQLGHRSLAAAQVYQRLDLTAAKEATDQAIAVMQFHAKQQKIKTLNKKR